MTAKIALLTVTLTALFILVVFVAFLSGVPLSEPARAWIFSGVPNWLQAIATVFTAYIVLKAFLNWRHQYVAQAQATQAPELLKALKDYLSAFHAARTGVPGYEIPPKRTWLKRVVTEQRAAAVAAFTESAEQLRLLGDLSPDEKTEGLISDLFRSAEDVQRAWWAVGDVLAEIDEEQEAADLTAADIPELEQHFKTLGLRRRHQTNDRAFRDGVTLTAGRLRAVLKSHITYKS